MDYIQDIFYGLLTAAKATLRNLKALPVLLLIQLAASAVYQLFFGLPGIGGGMLGGILMAVIRAALYSVYLYALYHAVHRSRFRTADIRTGAGVFFRDVYIATFVLWILGLFVGMIRLAALPIGLIILLVFSALPETVYLGRYNGFDNIRDALEFLRENWYIWLPVTLLMVFVLDRVSFGASFFVYGSIGSLSVEVLGRYLLHGVLFNLFALFRGNLFQYLYGSSLRKRKFMGNFR